MDKICVIGSLNIDLTCRVSNLPLKGQTILADDFEISCGGKGANQAYACARLGGQVSLLGCVGCDDNGNKLIENLNLAGVDISRIKRVGVNTGTAFINVDKEGNNSIVVSQGANRFCTPDYVLENKDIILEAKYVLIQMEIPEDTIKTIKEIAKENDIKLILNPAPIPNVLNRELFEDLFLLIPNETELNGIVLGNVSFDDKVNNILNSGVENVIVTLGEKGAFYKSKYFDENFKAFKVDAVDTVAAGDCFCGALAVGLSEGKSFKDSIMLASASAALAVSKKGAQVSIPSREEVDYFLENIEKK